MKKKQFVITGFLFCHVATISSKIGTAEQSLAARSSLEAKAVLKAQESGSGDTVNFVKARHLRDQLELSALEKCPPHTELSYSRTGFGGNQPIFDVSLREVSVCKRIYCNTNCCHGNLIAILSANFRRKHVTVPGKSWLKMQRCNVSKYATAYLNTRIYRRLTNLI